MNKVNNQGGGGQNVGSPQFLVHKLLIQLEFVVSGTYLNN